MALTLIATAGAPNANSYATLVEANAYHEAHAYASVWDDAADDAARERALVMATRLLDAQVDWVGEIATTSQALAWPRLWAVDRHGRSLSSSVIPQPIKDATAEYARQLLAGDRTLDRDSDVEGLARVKAGPVEVQFRDGSSGGAKVLPDAVWLLLTGYGDVVRGGGRARMARPLERA